MKNTRALSVLVRAFDNEIVGSHRIHLFKVPTRFFVVDKSEDATTKK